MIGNIGKDYIKLTGEKFARIVAYALGLGCIFWFLRELLGFFNALQTAIQGADLRAALRDLLISTAFVSAVLAITLRCIRWYIGRLRLQAVQEIEEAGEEAIGYWKAAGARLKEERDLLEELRAESDRNQPS